MLLLSACGGRDVVDTPVSWWHSLEGGAIAEQRPPPPGVDAPYPHIGTTPAAAPPVASADLRRSVTDQLVQQRNLAARLNAENPLPPPAPPPPPAIRPVASAVPGSPPAAPAPANQSSAVLDAVEAPANPTPPPAASAHAAAPPGRAVPATAEAEPELAMPALATGTAPPPAAVIPPIAQTPPAAPALPGVSSPPPPSYAPPSRPNYDLSEGRGELLFFPRGSDALDPGQDGILRALAGRRRDGSILVHGYGDAGSDAPADQAEAVALASLRARSVAQALQRDGVPPGSIRLSADAFGRGARAELVD